MASTPAPTPAGPSTPSGPGAPTAPDHAAHLVATLQAHREAVLWKLDGLGDYDVRRPLTPTGTNLLGLVKHLAHVEFGYLGTTFGRPRTPSLPAWSEEAELNDDMYAFADESREDVVGLYTESWRHGEGTVALGLDAMGRVPHWPEDRTHVDVRFVLVHLIAETARHAGHADILREQLDGAAGRHPERDNLPDVERDWWAAYVAKVQAAADAHR